MRQCLIINGLVAFGICPTAEADHADDCISIPNGSQQGPASMSSIYYHHVALVLA